MQMTNIHWKDLLLSHGSKEYGTGNHKKPV